MSNQQIKKIEQPRAIALMNQSINEIKKALPDTFTADRFVRIATTELRKNPKLAECDPYSFLGAVIQSAQLGLEIGSGLGYAYLVPYGSECTFIVGYKGDVDLARRSGKIGRIFLENIYSSDEYNYEIINGSVEISHKPKPGRKADEDIIATYGIAEFLAGGKPQITLMWRDEILYIRDKYSKGAKRPDSPWNTSFPEMCKKTVCRRLNKLLPKSADYQQAEAIESGELKTVQPFIDLGLIAESYTVAPEADITELAKQAAAEPEYKVPGQKDPEKEKALMDFDSILSQYESKKLNPDSVLSVLNIKVKDVDKMDAGRIRSVTKILTEKYGK